MNQISHSDGRVPEPKGTPPATIDERPAGQDEALDILESALEAPVQPAAERSNAVGQTTLVGRLVNALDVLGKRRRFLLNTRGQLRTALLTTAVALLLLVGINIALHLARQSSATAAMATSPELAEIFQSHNQLESVLVVLASVVFLIGVFVVTVLETHKTEGAAFNLARHMDGVRQGRLTTRLRLRKDDNLQTLEQAFNRMCQGLQQQCADDADSLERLAEEAARVASPIDAEELAVRLRDQAAQHRSRIS